MSDTGSQSPGRLETIRDRLRVYLDNLLVEEGRARFQAVSLQLTQLTLMALLAIVSLASRDTSFSNLLFTVVSIIVFLITGYLQIIHPDARWVQYRLLRAEMQKEYLNFEAMLGEYGDSTEAARIEKLKERAIALSNIVKSTQWNSSDASIFDSSSFIETSEKTRSESSGVPD